MANILENLAPDIYKAADVVGRELTGTIASSTLNADDSERAAVGQNVTSHFTRAATVVDIVPSMTIPEGTDQTVDTKQAQITNQKAVQIPWTGEDIRKVRSGAGFETIYGDQIVQAMRAIANMIEYDSNVELARNASRAVGTAQTTPFATNHNIVNEALEILVDNGAPENDGQIALCINNRAGTNFRNLGNLYKVNEAGTDTMLRQGILQDISGVGIRRTGSQYRHTKGTGTSYQLNGAAAAGAQTLTLDTGSGTILAGDIVTLAGDTNKYVVNTALAGGDIVIGETGLIEAAADNAALTVGNNYSSNIMFHRAAHEIIMRPPAVPDGGDSAEDSMLMQDPRSGLVFEISVYKGYKKAMIEVAAVWGVKTWLPKFVAQVLG